MKLFQGLYYVWCVSERQWPEDGDGEDQRENGSGSVQDWREEEEDRRGAERGSGEHTWRVIIVH